MSANMKILIGLIALALLVLISWWHNRREEREASEAGRKLPRLTEQDSREILGTAVRYLVWGGFAGRAEIIAAIPEVSGVDAGESLIAATVDAELAKKREAEKSWPERTDCDRLDDAFEALNERGIYARQSVGYTQDDGMQDVSEAMAEEPEEKYSGFCFYHEQDVERVVDGGRELLLAFGDSNVGEHAVEVGRAICEIMREFGFDTKWDETADTRIEVLNVDWKRRLA